MKEILLCLLPQWTTEYPYPGIWFVNQSLRDAGISSNVVDYNYLISKEYDLTRYDHQQWETSICLDPELISHLDKVVDDIVQRKPFAVGFALFYVNKFATEYVVKRLRQTDSEIKIFVGGPCFYQVNIWKSELTNGFVDAIVMGEGEISVPKLIQAWIDEKEPIFPGIETKTFFMPYKQIEDLSVLPVIKYDESIKNYKQYAIQMSRGCYGNCSFCNEGSYGGQYRYRPAEKIFEEMRYNKNVSKKSFLVVDSTIHPFHKEFRKLVELLKASPDKFSFGGNCRHHPRLTLDVAKELKSVGFNWVTFGTESGSDRVLKLMNKGVTSEIAVQNIRDCHSVGMAVSVNLIIGFPGETEIEFQETLEFLRKIAGYVMCVNVGYGMSIAYQTAIWENPQKYHIKVNSIGDIDYSSGDWESDMKDNNKQIRDKRILRVKGLLQELGVEYNPK
jgi:radical SAM superfamily enzyme YgiQ (UPF0313 family)